MRSRAAQFVLLLLLLSSLAGTDACAGGVERARTPGGVFVRNLLLQAAVEDSEPAASVFQSKDSQVFGRTARRVQSDVLTVRGAVAQAAHVHSVTGSSL